MQVNLEEVQYAGFGVRFLASVLDSIVQLCVIVPLVLLWFGPEYWINTEFDGGLREVLLNWVFPTLYVVLFWKYKSATPGKIWMGIMIVDAKTGGTPSLGQLVLRFVGYIVCSLTLFLGFLLILFDNRKRGLHDMIAGTLVIKTPVAAQESKHFMDQ
jgi:uncharacterized RDD family membrane protein YckC